MDYSPQSLLWAYLQGFGVAYYLSVALASEANGQTRAELVPYIHEPDHCHQHHYRVFLREVACLLQDREALSADHGSGG